MKCRAWRIITLRTRVMMVGMVVTVVVEVVVETTGVVVLGGIGQCGYKLGYTPAHHVSPSCHVCAWHMTNLG